MILSMNHYEGRLVMRWMFTELVDLWMGDGLLSTVPDRVLYTTHTKWHLSWRTTRLSANGQLGAACVLIFKDSYPPPERQ